MPSEHHPRREPPGYRRSRGTRPQRHPELDDDDESVPDFDPLRD
ncbi:hypothetical protein [Saccharopolyspora gloriosae]|nr:hypothetical protein [Saccharopolyspora gloriosae]